MRSQRLQEIVPQCSTFLPIRHAGTLRLQYVTVKYTELQCKPVWRANNFHALKSTTQEIWTGLKRALMRLWDWISLHLYRVMRQRAAKAKVGVGNLPLEGHGTLAHSDHTKWEKMRDANRCEWCKKCKKREVLWSTDPCPDLHEHQTPRADQLIRPPKRRSRNLMRASDAVKLVSQPKCAQMQTEHWQGLPQCWWMRGMNERHCDLGRGSQKSIKARRITALSHL